MQLQDAAPEAWRAGLRRHAHNRCITRKHAAVVLAPLEQTGCQTGGAGAACNTDPRTFRSWGVKMQVCQLADTVSEGGIIT